MSNSLRARINKLAYQGKLSQEDADRIRDALQLKAELEKALSTLKHIVDIQYEIFNKYDLYNHTEIEQIAFNEFGNTAQELQWLIGRLENGNESNAND